MVLIIRYFSIIIITILGLIPLLPLFHPGFPITHDGQDHVARIANFYQSLSEGNFVPRWAGNLNWGFGHPILMFLYPFPSYLASLFHFLGFSLVDSVKLVFGLTYIFSGIAMYLWARNIFGERGGVVAGVLYMYAPYRFVDLYVRGAIGEHVAFLFAPLIFYFLLKLSKNINYWHFLGGVLVVAGLLLSHNALAIMFLPIAGIYAIYLIRKSNNKKLLTINYALLVSLGFGLSSFFLAPAFFEGKYTLRDIVTGSGEYKQGFVFLVDFISLSWSYGGTAYLSKQIGVIQIASIILGSTTFFILKKKKQTAIYFLLLFSFIISLFLMLPYSNFIWENVSLIQKFQFPWRLMSIVVFASAGLSSFIFIKDNKNRKQTILAAGIIICAVILYLPYYRPQGYLLKHESFYTGIYKSTTDTGESSPIWSVRFMENTASKSAQVISGNAIIKNIYKTSAAHAYRIRVTSDTARIQENTLYFPNWQVFIDKSLTSIEFQDPAYRGLITFYVPKGEHEVLIKFGNTKLREIASVISIVSVFSLVIILLIYNFKRVK